MTDYQNWNGSRWDFTKQQSNWHFDFMKPPEEGKDSFTFVGNFFYDYTDIISKLIPEAKPNTWSNRNLKLKGEDLYCTTEEEQDLIRAGADPKMHIFSRTYAKDIPVFQKISNYLGIEDADIKFHNQTTGQMLVTHIDNFAGRLERENSFKVTEMDVNPNIIRRFTVMLSDWKLGQVFQLGNATWSQWKAGDCITWEWKDIPHSTCNMGWWDRPMLQITGLVTDRTTHILNSAGKNNIINVERI